MRLALCAYDCYDVFKYTKDWMAAMFCTWTASAGRVFGYEMFSQVLL